MSLQSLWFKSQVWCCVHLWELLLINDTPSLLMVESLTFVECLSVWHPPTWLSFYLCNEVSSLWLFLFSRLAHLISGRTILDWCPQLTTLSGLAPNIYNSEIQNSPGGNLLTNHPLKETFQTLAIKAPSSPSYWFPNKKQKYQSPKWYFGGWGFLKLKRLGWFV